MEIIPFPEQIDAYWIDDGKQVRVLCSGHWRKIEPSASGVRISNTEQQHSRLHFGAPIRCEECQRR